MQCSSPYFAAPVRVPATRTASQERVIDWLRHCALFSHMGMPELTRIAAECMASTCPTGTTLFLPGARADGFYIVIFGSVSLMLQGPDRVEKLVELVGPGECFGQAAMFLEMPFPVASRCLGETLLLHVPRQPVFELLDHDTVLAKKMLAGMAFRMHRLIHDIEGYAFRSAASRIADYLLTLAAGVGPSFRLPVSKGTVASKLLIAPETLSRVLKAWMAAGHIEMHGRSMTLRDTDSLRGIACCDRS